MSYHIDWYIPEKIIYARYSGRGIQTEVEAFDAALVEKLDHAQPPCCVIIDARQFAGLGDVSLKSVPSLQQYLKHPHLGWVVAMGGNVFVRMVATIVANTTRFQLKMVANPQEAIDFLKQQDATMDWSAANTALLQE